MKIKIGLFIFSFLWVYNFSWSESIDPHYLAQINVLEARNESEIVTFLNKIKKAGFEGIILRAFQLKGDRTHRVVNNQTTEGVYFKTEYAPLVYELFPLVVEIGHRQGLKVWAWMTTRNCRWKMKDEWLEKKYNFATKRIEPGKGLDIFNPEAVNYLKLLYQDLARTGVDGILIQDDLILRHNVGFGRYIQEKFKEKYGIDLSPFILYKGRKYLPYFWKWIELKTDQLIEVVESLSRAVREVNSSVFLGLNIYYETLLSPKNGLAWYSQDIDKLALSSIDYLFFMIYHRQIKQELVNSEQENLAIFGKLMNEISKKKIEKKAFVKLQIRDWIKREVIKNNELKRYFNLIPDNITGMVFFPIDSYTLSSLKSVSTLF
ncbi:MAG: poly-beta-1,6-N-acetyl-D-glucosamine N-deacetylase PgaB [Candidatus Aminicenantia bacterium]